jgi:IS30 family transposase
MSCLITMSQKELHRLEVIRKIRDQRLSIVQAAELLDLCRSQVLRAASGNHRPDHAWLSPQQIAGRLRLEGQKHCVSHETIYKFAYSSDGQAIKLWRHLLSIGLVAVRDMPDAIMAVASARKSIVSTARRLWQNASNSVTGNAISSSFGRSSAKPT